MERNHRWIALTSLLLFDIYCEFHFYLSKLNKLKLSVPEILYNPCLSKFHNVLYLEYRFKE